MSDERLTIEQADFLKAAMRFDSFTPRLSEWKVVQECQDSGWINLFAPYRFCVTPAGKSVIEQHERKK